MTAVPNGPGIGVAPMISGLPLKPKLEMRPPTGAVESVLSISAVKFQTCPDTLFRVNVIAEARPDWFCSPMMPL